MWMLNSKWRWLPLILVLGGAAIGGLRYRGYFEKRARAAAELECRTLRNAARWEELAEVARSWSEWDANRADPWLYRAEASEQTRDAVKTAEYLSRVPDSDARATAALSSLAALQFDVLNRPRDGVATCERFLRIDPRVTKAHTQLIYYALLTLQREELVRRIRAAIRIRRESPESYVFLAGAHWLYPAILYDLNTHWLEAEPDCEMYQVARAMQVYNSNAKENPERAKEFEHIPTATELLKKFPHNTEVLAYHLELKMAEGDIQAVQHLLDAANPSTSEDARFWLAKSWIQDTRGEAELAEKSLKRAMGIDPYWWKPHFQMLELCRQQQRSADVLRFTEIYQRSKRLSKLITTLEDGASASPEFYELIVFVADAFGDTLVANSVRDRQLTK